MTDPEPDRYEIATRDDGWQIPAISLGLLDAIDEILDKMGCKSGHHEWTALHLDAGEDIRWSKEDVVCEDCGATARVSITSGPDPTYWDGCPQTRKVTSVKSLAEALAASRDKTFEPGEDVLLRSMPIGYLWRAFEEASRLIGGSQ
jgi:hypothetical protein